MEQLLHYVWKHKLFPLTELRTTAGQPVEVIDPGLGNPNAGPDFLNAKLKLNGMLWVGNVEIHEKSSDWYRHGHDTNPVYDSVILHITQHIDCEVCRTNGEPIPQLLLTCPDSVRANYRELLETDQYPPCYRIIPTLPHLTLHAWMAALQLERFEEKTEAVRERLQHADGNWEDAFFVTLARNFGFGLNGDAFETWARHIPLRAVDKHRNDLFQIEAIFFGQAGLLQEPQADPYYQRLQKEYAYLQHKFELTPIDPHRWRFLRLRPNNFPHVRIAQLACLYHHSYGLLSQVLEAESLAEVRTLLKGGTSDYWLTHYTFSAAAPSRPKTLSPTTLDLLLINTVVPFLYAYGKHKDNEALCARASRFLEELKPENNHIIRLWSECGLTAAHAGDSQALIQLKKNYCDRKKCLYCRIGYEYLKRKK